MSNDKTKLKSQCQNSVDVNSKYDLSERLLKYAKRIVEIVKLLPTTPEGNVLRKQLMASGTSVGANYEEADGAVSKKDFINKMGIARKEAKESKYWLRVISGEFVEESVIRADIKESSEIINIFSTIINKSRSSKV
jgi:four helix bundle protein